MEEKEQKQEIQDINISVEDRKKENLRIQKTEWIYNQIQKQRAAEDALFEQIRQEQDVLDTLNQSIENNMNRTKEARKYNQEFQENMNAQVYAMYGITEDKLQGIREYKNAYYQGCAFSLFLLSMVLVGLCGMLHGFQSQICLFMIAFSGIEGALLTQEKKRGRLLDLCCKGIYLLMFPLMMVIFVCYELDYPEYNILLPILAVFGIGVLVIGTAAYFFYNPYRKEKKKVGEAKDAIRGIEKTAKKEVKKNQKVREKWEKKQQKLLGKEAVRQQKLLEKETERQQKRLEKEEERQQKLLEREEKQQEKLLEKPKQQLWLEKKDALLSHFQKKEKDSSYEETEEGQEITEGREAAEIEDYIETVEAIEEKELENQEEGSKAAEQEKPAEERKTSEGEEAETTEGEEQEEARTEA
ncbi:MAG: hypothetical protein HFH41_07155 [Lachnospiraceae bacterium]|nr:hypothetical protein [Lachnospiraceae bacterium]